MTHPIANARLRPIIAPTLAPVIISAAITSVYAVIAPWMPVTVVPTSFATVAIDTFITELSSVIRNCPAASVRSTIPAPLAAAVVVSDPSIGRMLLGGGGRRAHELRGDDQPLARGVLRVAGREDQRWIRRLLEHLARGLLGQDEVRRDHIVELPVARDEADRVARLHLIEMEERVQIRGAVPCDADATGRVPGVGGVGV